MIEQNFKDWLILDKPKFKRKTANSYFGRLRKYEKYYGKDLSSLNREQLISAFKKTFYNPMQGVTAKQQTDVRSAIRMYIRFRGIELSYDAFKNLESAFIGWMTSNRQSYFTAVSIYSRLNRLFRFYGVDAKDLDINDLNQLLERYNKMAPDYITGDQVSYVRLSLKRYIEYKKSNG